MAWVEGHDGHEVDDLDKEFFFCRTCGEKIPKDPKKGVELEGSLELEGTDVDVGIGFKKEF